MWGTNETQMNIVEGILSLFNPISQNVKYILEVKLDSVNLLQESVQEWWWVRAGQQI